MKKYLRDYEEDLGFMKSLKRFKDWCEENIKNKRDLEKMRRLFERFESEMIGVKRDYYLFRSFVKKNS